ncbi:MAG: metallophosphoesterase family protein, partial [bacterium]
MKYAIISDIHGNLEALEKVLAEIDRLDVDEILCLGDVVGYGPNPNECVQIIRQRAQYTLAGNHDYAPIGKLDISYFNPWARSAIEWTAKELTATSVEFLSHLPLKAELDGFTIVHATPYNPEDWNYINTIGDAALNFPEFDNQICFIGHSHVPMIVTVDKVNDYRVSKNNPLKILKDFRYIINVGSVGQPRDFNPKASFSIYDNKAKVYENFRIEYA